MNRRILGFIASFDLRNGQRKTSSDPCAANKLNRPIYGNQHMTQTSRAGAARNTNPNRYSRRFATAVDCSRVPMPRQAAGSIHQTADATAQDRRRSGSSESYSRQGGAMLSRWRSCAEENPKIPSAVSAQGDKRPQKYSTTPERDRRQPNLEPTGDQPS